MVHRRADGTLLDATPIAFAVFPAGPVLAARAGKPIFTRTSRQAIGE